MNKISEDINLINYVKNKLYEYDNTFNYNLIGNYEYDVWNGYFKIVVTIVEDPEKQSIILMSRRYIDYNGEIFMYPMLDHIVEDLKQQLYFNKQPKSVKFDYIC